MFKCGRCGKTTESREKENRVVVAKRDTTYSNDGKNSSGWEIKKEISVCDRCESIRLANIKKEEV